MANDLTKVNDLQNSLLESIQTVVNKALFQLDKDVTKICTITNIDKRSTGEYTVKDEVVEYQAYSADSSLTLDDRVYVLVPNGNQNNQKLIIGKVLTEKEAPYIYRSPFESIIETSSNLVSGTAEMELIANVEKIPNYSFEIKAAKEDNKFNVTIKGKDYTITQEKLYELGLASVRNFYNLFKGTAFVTTENGDIADFSPASFCLKTISITEPIDEILGLKFDIKTLLNTCNSGTYGVRLGINGKIQGESAYRIVEFLNDEMFGNTYDFAAFATQEKTFDVGAFESISQIDVLFFQGNNFITKDNKELSYPWAYDEDQNLLKKDEIVPNIFLNNLYICFGKAIPTTGADYAFISCKEGKHYSRYNIEIDGKRVKEKEQANNKSLVLKWLHNFEDGSYKLATLNNEKPPSFKEAELTDYYFDFYRYDIGSAGDPNGGVFWQKIKRITGDNNKNPTLTFTPNVDLQNELIKVVITKKVNDSYTMILTSDILTLENDEKVNNRTVAEYLADLVIKPDDETNGQYYIYNEAGQLIDSTQAEKRRWFNFALLKNKISLSGDDYLKIDFPTEKTMFEFYTYKDNESENPSKITDGHILIKPKGSETINLTMENKKDEDETDSKLPYFYKIKYYNNPSYINNTVKVTLQVSKKLYYAEINMGFGIQGTKGTERTLIVELAGNYPYVYHKPNDVNNQFYDLDIFLQDEQGNITNLNEEGSEIRNKLTLSWYNKNIKNDFLEIKNVNKYFLQANWSFFANENNEFKGYGDLINYPEKYIYILKVEFQGGTYKPPEGKEVTLNALEAYLPIPIRSQYETAMVSGPTSVYYLSDGSTEFQKAPYKIDNNDGTFKIVVDDDDFITKEKAWSDAQNNTTMTNEEKNKIKKAYDAAKAFVGELDDENKLKVPTFYLKDSPNYAVLAKTENGNFFGIYPILVLQNKYPSRVINKWDGKTLTIDNDNGLILSTAIAAGKKNPDNTFSGVMLGDWSNTPSTSDLRAQTGIYGFHNGEMSYAFKEDGTAFIGTSSNGGRIEFNGNKGLIKSANYDTIHQGMEINLGSYSDSKLTPPKITMKASDIDSTIKAIEIGKNFNVDWNGNIWTKGGTITAGVLQSYEDNDNEIGIIKLKGYLSVFDESVTGSLEGIIGYAEADLGDNVPFGKEGIAIGVKLDSWKKTKYVSKVITSTRNTGMSYGDYYISLTADGISIGYAGTGTGTINYNNIEPYAVFG